MKVRDPPRLGRGYNLDLSQEEKGRFKVLTKS